VGVYTAPLGISFLFITTIITNYIMVVGPSLQLARFSARARSKRRCLFSPQTPEMVLGEAFLFWLIGVVSFFVLIPAGFVYNYRKMKRAGKGFKDCFRPTAKWGPAVAENWIGRYAGTVRPESAADEDRPKPLV